MSFSNAQLALQCTNTAIPGTCPPVASNAALCYYDTPGCMDPNATNYNPDETVDDGSSGISLFLIFQDVQILIHVIIINTQP